MLPGLTGHLVGQSILAALEPQPEHRSSIDRSRRELLEWRRLRAALGPTSTTRAVLETAATPLARALGYDLRDVNEAPGGVLVTTLHANGQTVTLLVTPWRESLDRSWRLAVVQAGRRTTRWCAIFNGTNIRVVDARRLYSRRYLDFDVELAIDDPGTFLALWRTLSPVALADNASDAVSLRALVLESDRHAAAVCRDLRAGVLKASADVLQALVTRRRMTADWSVDDSFEQALTIVYRVLFLLFAEARLLVPLWHPVYRESYSIESLCEAAQRSPHRAGCWDALRAIARLAHSGCRAGDLRVTAFNGRLFSPARTPLAERRDLDDAAAERAVLALSTRPAPDRGGREPVAYRDLGVEQLGAVYETLLEYQPRVTGRHPATVRLESGSGARKATGSFYTPQPIAEYLVRRTLGPLVRGASAENILRLRVVDPAMGSGAFLVAACRYLATAYEHALVSAGGGLASDITEQDRIGIRRTVAERCLYGVDLNPMAVQLARLSLWLATLAADRPLTFLDHRLTTGNSLVGTWLRDLRRRPEGRAARRLSTLPLFPDHLLAEALGGALPIRFSLEAAPAGTIEQVRAKERALASLTRPDAVLSRWKRIANIWCATWFASGTSRVPAEAFTALSDCVLAGSSALPDVATRTFLEAAEAVALTHRFFHWELEFPEVFFEEGGHRMARPGFDAVLGNPPWDMMRADGHPRESRSRANDDAASVVRFTREAGIYHSQSTGHANRYQLFVERSVALTRPGGRIGLVLPSGLATDHGSASLRRLLFDRCDVDAIVGIDNRRGVFPIHRGLRFLLVTASCGSPTRQVACRLGLEDAGALEQVGDGPVETAFFPVHLSPAMLERLSGPDLAIPNVKNAMDLAIAEKAAALFPALGSAHGWGATFGRELNATDDRDVFLPAGRGLPIVDGRHLEPFRVAVGSSLRSIDRADARRLLGPNRFDRPRLAYRDVASATNRLTLVAAMLPEACVSTHTVFCLRTPLPSRAQYFLCGLFNSYVVNFLVRLRVTTHVMTSLVERLPLPTADAAPAAFRDVSALGRLLSRRSNPTAAATLNARVAQLYQLTPAEFAHILSSFPLIPAEQRQAALQKL